MREELIHLFKEADQDDAVRVVVVTGAAHYRPGPGHDPGAEPPA